MTAKERLDDIEIPEEEWSMLVNAVDEPVKQMIAIEAKNAAQMREVEHRLQNLAGTRIVLPPAVSPGEESPEAVWMRCAQQLISEPMPALPLLIVSVDVWPEDAQQIRQLAEFWRGMNQLRENWHELPAQVIFLLSPAAYEHLTLNADHLKRWISLKLRLWPGSTNLAVLARPGKTLRHALDATKVQHVRDGWKAALKAAKFPQVPDGLKVAMEATKVPYVSDGWQAAMEAAKFPQVPDGLKAAMGATKVPYVSDGWKAALEAAKFPQVPDGLKAAMGATKIPYVSDGWKAALEAAKFPQVPDGLKAAMEATKVPHVSDSWKASLEAAERLPNAQLKAAKELKAAMEAASFPQMPNDPYMRINRLSILARQAKSVYRTQGEKPVELVRRYYLPLISGYLALGDREEAMFWRKKIKNKWVLDEQENRVLRNLDFKLKASDYCYDVSLSYNRKDLHSVSELSKYLEKQGLSVWLSEDEPLSGLPWQDLLEIGFRKSRSVAVLIGQDGLGPWEDTEVRTALVQAVKDNCPVIPVLLPDAPNVPHLPFFLADRTWVDLRPAITKENLGRLVWGITGKKPD
jgi:hypothetical protein